MVSIESAPPGQQVGNTAYTGGGGGAGQGERGGGGVVCRETMSQVWQVTGVSDVS